LLGGEGEEMRTLGVGSSSSEEGGASFGSEAVG
jgi:hypothetical protein